MRDYEENNCTTCTHYYVCQIRAELLAWLEKHRYPLKNQTSSRDDVLGEFEKLLSKWCCRKELTNDKSS